jgi:peptidoglycan/xylan/chitin deacetylase (PgdA/CDA1 family)
MLFAALLALITVFVPPPILMYHRVDVAVPGDRVGRQLTVTPAQFDRELLYLKRQGITAISMVQLQQRIERGMPLDRVAVLTFDDGYADQYTYALPVLRKYKDTATFYIVTGDIGDRRHMSWRELRTLSALHMDVAAHGVHHDDLSLMTPAQQAYQIDTSIATLQNGLHEPVTSYAYPSGRFNRATLRIVGASGVAFAVTTDARYVIPPENRFEMTRLRVRGEWTAADFAAALQSAMRMFREPIRLPARF